MANRSAGSPSLALEDLRRMAKDLKEDLQRKANQGIRKKDWEQGIGSLAGIEAIEELERLCEQRAHMLADAEQRITERMERRKPGSNITTLPPSSPAVRKRQKTGAAPDEMPGWARERVKA
jgi:hypothetical protein